MSTLSSSAWWKDSNEDPLDGDLVVECGPLEQGYKKTDHLNLTHHRSLIRDLDMGYHIRDVIENNLTPEGTTKYAADVVGMKIWDDLLSNPA